MRHLLIAATVALIALAGPLATHARAVEAHHPEKAAKAKESKANKAKQKKSKPAAESDKAKQSGIEPGAWTWRT